MKLFILILRVLDIVFCSIILAIVFRYSNISLDGTLYVIIYLLVPLAGSILIYFYVYEYIYSNPNRPFFVEEEYMSKIGYNQVNDKDGYLKYENKAGLQVADYGKMGRGKRIIYFNCNYYTSIKWKKSGVYMSIREDGDTRTVFSGVVKNVTEFTTILNAVR
jgi:hypothetical protein